jgi:hypothetical protein
VTCLRVKLLERDKKSKAKGEMSEQRDGTQTVTIILRPENKLSTIGWQRTSHPLLKEVDERVVQEKVK